MPLMASTVLVNVPTVSSEASDSLEHTKYTEAIYNDYEAQLNTVSLEVFIIVSA